MSWSSWLHPLLCISLTSGVSFGTHEEHHATSHGIACDFTFYSNYLDMIQELLVPKATYFMLVLLEPNKSRNIRMTDRTWIGVMWFNIF